jgi:hypothetical protein
MEKLIENILRYYLILNDLLFSFFLLNHVGCLLIDAESLVNPIKLIITTD